MNCPDHMGTKLAFENKAETVGFDYVLLVVKCFQIIIMEQYWLVSNRKRYLLSQGLFA